MTSEAMSTTRPNPSSTKDGHEAPAPPVPVNGYEIGEVLGRGGMATVYRARRTADGATVAIKIMAVRPPASRQSRALLQREIGSMWRLVHPNIVPIYQWGLCGQDVFYVAMELCAGGSLSALMRRRGRVLPIAEAGAIFPDVVVGPDFTRVPVPAREEKSA